MRLGLIAAIVFAVVSLAIMQGAVDNQSLLARAGGTGTVVQEDVNNMMQAAKTVQESGIAATVVTIPSAVFTYFDSLVSMTWKTFSHNIFSSDAYAGSTWALVPYFILTPMIVVLFFGLIMLTLSILRSAL